MTRLKRVPIAVVFTIILFFSDLQYCLADAIAIKGAMKIHRMGGYVISINYETRDRWTDGLLFKVLCRFDDGEFVFTSSSMNNVERGWHKTQIAIADVIKRRYGSLREYEIELYKNGILVDKKKSF